MKALAKILGALLATCVVALTALGGFAVWLGYSAPGLRWALERAQAASAGRLQIEAARGTLAEGFDIETLEWRSDDLRIAARTVHAKLDLSALLAATLRVDGLHAASVEISPLSPGERQAAKPPAKLGLPVSVQTPFAEVDKLVFDTYAVSALRFSYSGGVGGHELREVSALTPWGRASLEARMAAAPPFSIAASGALERREGKVVVREARILPFAERKIESLQALAEGIDLRAFDAALPRTSLQIELQGASSADALLAGSLSAVNAQPGTLDRDQLPLRSLSARFAVKGNQAFIDELQAQAAGGTLRGRATLEAGRAQLVLQLARIDLKAVLSSLRRTHLAGHLQLDLDPRRQAARGKLSQDDLQLTADAVRTGDRVDIRSLHAEAGGGTVKGAGSVDLGKPISARGKLQFSRFDPSRFGDYPEGSISGSAEISGNPGAPRRLAAQWTVRDSVLAGRPLASEGRAMLSGERLHEVDASAQWGANRLSATGAFGGSGDALAWRVRAPQLPVGGFSGEIDASGTLGGSWSEPRVELAAKSSPAMLAGRLRAQAVQLDAAGSLSAHRVTGRIVGEDFDIRAELRGGWSRESGWRGELVELRNAGRYPLQLAAPVGVHLSPERVEVAPLRAALGDGHLLIQKIDWAPGRLVTRGEFSGLPARWMLVPAGLAGKLRSTLLLDGHWSIESTPELNGMLSVRRAGGDLSIAEPTALDLGLGAAALEARFENGGANATLNAVSALGTLRFEGTAAGFARDSALRFTAQLEGLDLRTLAGPLPLLVRVAGRGSAAIEGRGTLGAPELAGRASAEALSIHLPAYGVYLEDGRLRATLQGDSVRVDELSLRGGEGKLTASGRLPLLPSQKAASLQWKAQNLRLLGRPDMRLVVSGGGSLGLEDKRLALQGSLRVDNGLFERGLARLPKLGDDVVIVGNAPEPESTRRSQMPADIDLLVDLGERFEVREAGFDGRLKGEVHVSSVGGGDVRAFGRIEAAGATYSAYGQKLAVDPGVVIFNGPLGNPALQISAWRRNQAVWAGVRITGNLQQPRVELVSEPAVPEGTALSWLVLGRAPSDTGGADIGVLQTAATALLGRGNSVPVTTRIAQAVGLDELSLRNSSVGSGSGSTEPTSRVVAVGKRISDRIYLTYEQGIGTVVQSLVKIDLALTNRISLRAQTGTTSGLGAYYRYSWD